MLELADRFSRRKRKQEKEGMAAAGKDDWLDEQRHADRAFERLVSLRLVAFEARRRTEEE